MPEKNQIQLVRAEIVRLKERYPDLPNPPEAFYGNKYEGWFKEAKKRFELQSYNQTQAERIEVLKKIAELNTLFLTIDRQSLTAAQQQEEKVTFKEEQLNRHKKIEIEGMELDQRKDDLTYEREQKSRERANAAAAAASPPKTAKPRSPAQEFAENIRTKFRTAAEVKAECDRLKKELPDQADEIEREYKKWIAVERERR